MDSTTKKCSQYTVSPNSLMALLKTQTNISLIDRKSFGFKKKCKIMDFGSPLTKFALILLPKLRYNFFGQSFQLAKSFRMCLKNKLIGRP
jgi:hypothetical protein